MQPLCRSAFTETQSAGAGSARGPLGLCLLAFAVRVPTSPTGSLKSCRDTDHDRPLRSFVVSILQVHLGPPCCPREAGLGTDSVGRWRGHERAADAVPGALKVTWKPRGPRLKHPGGLAVCAVGVLSALQTGGGSASQTPRTPGRRWGAAPATVAAQQSTER